MISEHEVDPGTSLLARAGAPAAALLLASCVATTPRLPALDPTPLLDGASTRVDVRTGYDGAAADGGASGAGGITLQGNLGWTSGEWRGFEAQFGYDDFYARAERVADGLPGATASRLRVPTLSRVAPANASLAWSDGRTRVALGRQALAPAGERFLGVVGWRPGEQSYDGVRVQRELLGGAHVSYTWAGGVATGERPDAAAARWQGRFHLLDGRLDAGRLGHLQGFVYRMAFADAIRTDATATDGGAQSGATFGAAWRREFRLGEFAPLPIALSYASATRHDADGAPYDARYLQLETGVPVANTRLKVGRGALARDPRSAPGVRGSPLSSWYASEGWSGRFQGAGAPGAVDTYALLQADVAGMVVELGRHDFRSPGPADADGVEWNTTLSRRLAQWLHVQARYADLRGAVGDDRRWFLEVSAPIR
jgi:hypothetical protein